MATVLSLLMLTLFALVGGGVYLWRQAGMRKQAVLMLVLAGVVAVNLAIWTIPDSSGEAPAGREPERAP